MKMKLYDALFGILLLALALIAVYTISVGFWWLFTTACNFTGINRWVMALCILVFSTIAITVSGKKDGE